MAYSAYITRIKNLHKHPNADRLQIGECFGNSVVVSLDYEDNQLGIYFPCDGQLSTEFAEANNLVRKKDDAGNNIGGYMDPNQRKVTAIRLRGEKSDGLFLPLSALSSFGSISSLKEGDALTVFNGHEICCKYIPRSNRTPGAPGSKKSKVKIAKVDVAPLFEEHKDTAQLAYNLNAFKPGDEIEISLKMHGTSQRTGYLPVFKGWKVNNPFFQGIVNKYATNPNLSKFAQKCVEIAMRGATPIYEWGYVSGTRRTVLDDYEGGYYGSNEFRERHSKKFEGKLWKGETVYYEVVGFTHTGTPIMPVGDNKKVGKDFAKQYGAQTVFSYGCSPYPIPAVIRAPEMTEISRAIPQNDVYVYRMTMTNEDGDVVEYSPDFMRYRCEQMGVKCVPVLWKGYLSEPDDWCGSEWNAGDFAKLMAEEYYDGPDPVGKTHVREGVVVRILNRPTFTAYKHKNHDFKVLSGIAVEQLEQSGKIENVSDDILAEM